ncbi:hypothetical protein ACFFX0_17750 [Citricoccus parietis]|uniref:Uncharacterized protein n=1 Tax=Citricoccus parietis TaxID=592307 RepID=A0ABV5G1Y1_9MICC
MRPRPVSRTRSRTSRTLPRTSSAETRTTDQLTNAVAGVTGRHPGGRGGFRHRTARGPSARQAEHGLRAVAVPDGQSV